MKNEKRNFAAEITTFSNGLYQESIIKRAVARGGHCPNLKGHINEIMTVDKLNTNLHNIINGKKAYLTKSTTAMRDDIIVKKSGKVVERYQLKDTPKGIHNTIRKVEQHQYKGTNLMGTKETVAAYNNAIQKANAKGKKISQKMTSNGISSEKTALLSAQVLGGSISQNLKCIGKAAQKTGAMSAALGGGIEAIKDVSAVYHGKEHLSEAVTNTAKEAGISYASAAIGEATNIIVTIGVAATPANAFAKPAGNISGTAMTCLSYKGLKKISQKSKPNI